MSFGEILGDIKKEKFIHIGNLVYPGKIMGLVSYGTPRLDWVPAFKKYYFSRPNSKNFMDNLKILGDEISVNLTENRLVGQTAYDVAATSQYAFEEILFEILDPIAQEYNLPFCFAGGCALNILANTKIIQRYNRELFVGPNPNDCGISLGMMLDFIRPEQAYDATYAGLPILDMHMLPHYLSENRFKTSNVELTILARLIVEGKIIGIARGNSEHGPRALGNRSIICNPMIQDMKDILNSKVKNREWYRPFAPVVRLEDVNEYFEWNTDARWMSFAPRVREKYRSILPSITHFDNTARVQTVTREQNMFLYDLITEIKNITGIGVLLNTSFNVDGKPILTTVKDIFKILTETRLDGVLVEETLVLK
jgi:carbamoyltransferase